MEYPSPHRCGACDAPAVFRFALCAPDERPAAALERRPVFRCPACFAGGKPDYVADCAPETPFEWVLVLDRMFTRLALDPRCDCGLPADHRNPLSGLPRPCADETARIALPGRDSRPPARPVLAALHSLVTRRNGDPLGATVEPPFITGDERGDR